VRSITLADINDVANEICEHFLGLCAPGPGAPAPPLPASIVACVPSTEGNVGVEIAPGVVIPSKDDIVRVIRDAASLQVEEQEEVVVPDTLITKEDLAGLAAANPPQSKAAVLPAGVEEEECDGVEMRVFGNGLKVNFRRCEHESQRGHLRLQVPGGRNAEDVHGIASVLVGARTMQEGGAVLDFAREQVELFCIDHLLMVEIMATEEAVTFDFTFPTTRPDGSLEGEGGATNAVTGLEAVLQITRCILDGYIWEEDAFRRACQGFNQAYEASSKSLEGAATEALAGELTGQDKRFLTATPEDISALSLEQVREAMLALLRPDNAEVTVSGDFAPGHLEGLLQGYLGTIPAAAAAAQAPAKANYPPSFPFASDAAVDAEGVAKTINVYLPDSEERAMAYVAGLSPNKWGFLPGGEKITDRMAEVFRAQERRELDAASVERWEHPLFAQTALALLQECINRRLFSHVRETRRLTYDANAQLCQFDAIQGSLFLFSVTSSPDKVEAARDAVIETLNIMSDYYPISEDNMQSAKRVLLGRHAADSRTNRYWVDLMTGIQCDGVPKDIRCVTDVEDIITSVTLRDVKLLFDALQLKDRPVSVLAVSSPQA